MSEDGPKLYANKPKKAERVSGSTQRNDCSSLSSPTMAAAQASSAPPPQPPKESFARRYKFLWPLLLTVNLGVGAYLFMRTKSKDVDENVIATVSTTAQTTTTEKPLPSPIITEPVKLLEPIPEDHQHQLFKWMLEEKRKVKPKDPEKKKHLGEEKAILKQFLRAKSLPTI